MPGARAHGPALAIARARLHSLVRPDYTVSCVAWAKIARERAYPIQTRPLFERQTSCRGVATQYYGTVPFRSILFRILVTTYNYTSSLVL